MERRILVGWAEDRYWYDVQKSLECYLGENGIELYLMSALVDVFTAKNKMSKKRRFDLLVLDYKMDEETFSSMTPCYATPERVRSEALRMEKWAGEEYYLNDNPSKGGFYIWLYFRKTECEPLGKNRIIVYSAYDALRKEYEILERLGIIRIRPKTLYLFPFEEDPSKRWDNLYRNVFTARFESLEFSLLTDARAFETLQIENLDCCRPSGKPVYYIVDFVSSRDIPNGGQVILIKVPDNLYDASKIWAQQSEFLNDLEEIGMAYLKSAEVDKDLLNFALSQPVKIDMPLSSDGDNCWTLRTLFPAYYNKNAIFFNNPEKRLALEQKIKRETVINWSYEFGRLLRSGACFLSGHSKDAECYDYSGNMLKKRTNDGAELKSNIESECREFEVRTGLEIPNPTEKLYQIIVDPPGRHNATPMVYDYTRHQAGFLIEINGVFNYCKFKIAEYRYNIPCKNPYLVDCTFDEQFRQMLSMYPDDSGTPIHNSKRQLIVKGTPNPWTLKRILNDSFWDDIFRERGNKIWGNDINHAFAFFYGDIKCVKEGNESHIGRCWRFFCIARTTLHWDLKQMRGHNFLNETKRGWYKSGMHYHVDFHIVNIIDGNTHYFNLVNGENNDPTITPPQFLQQAHQKVVAAIRDKGWSNYPFCTFDYFGYHCIMGDGE